MSKKGSAASILKLVVPSGKATPSPPVGPALGQRGVKSMDFCKQFNDRTKHLLPEIPIPTVITITPDRKFTFVTKSPPTSWLLKNATGIKKGSGKTGKETLGSLSLKHIYEIACIKQKDDHLSHLDLQSICKAVIASAGSIGIKVVP
ncbi:mitochondrial 54S ribosomal protein YmL19 [Mycoemilia scoparia]|uniref:Large ribosomal subunit protein uL11m n=1 Tax=Mycoemilia scoparia TaxID=417184 RepID=A0A9W8DSR2_9FUNG|nr:mitochondrial 54S ribosomal protein YmL19 [Mycoemilia scoparia]